MVLGIYGALIDGILVLGASKENNTAILVWIVFAILECVGLAFMMGLVLFALLVVGASEPRTAIILIFSLIIYGAIFGFILWTIFIAKEAKRR